MSTLHTIVIGLALSSSLLSAGCMSEEEAQRSAMSGSSELNDMGKADSSAELNDELVTQEPEGCVFDAGDRFEPRTTFVDGPWVGACHDTRKRRPVDLLSEDDAWALQDPSGYLAIYNVYHRGAFWVAFVPKSAVYEVYFQLEYFPAVVPAGHTQLRLEYAEPVRLYGQSTSVKGLYDEVFDLTLSIEAVTRPGDSYDLFKGTQEHFAIAYRVTTMEARFEDMVVRQGHHVEQWRLTLEEDEAEALLGRYVSMSAEHQLDYSYHTLFKNCTTDIIKALDAVVSYTWREQVQRFLVKVTEVYPNIVRAALISRGLLPLDQSTDWYPLEEDEAFIERYEERAAD